MGTTRRNRLLAAADRGSRLFQRFFEVATLVCLVLTLPPLWLVVGFLSTDLGRPRLRSGTVRLVIIRGHGRFAICDRRATLRYLDKAIIGRVQRSESAQGARPWRDWIYFRSSDYSCEIYFSDGRVYYGPAHFAMWRGRLISTFPSTGLYFRVGPHVREGPENPPRGIRRLVAFLDGKSVKPERKCIRRF